MADDRKLKDLSVLQEKQCFAEEVQFHVLSNLGNDPDLKNKYRYFNGLAYSVRDRLIQMWINTQRSYYDAMVKRVYYLSMEFLPGRFLMSNLVNMQMDKSCEKIVEDLGFTLEELEEEEWDAGLGNGGLGRLASCYIDSMASLRIPGYGYGIMYDYGIFHQKIVDGYQQEASDNWRRHGSPWEIVRREFLYSVNFYGRTEPYTDADGQVRRRWVDTEKVMAMPCDILVPGYGAQHVTNMRLWSAQSSEDFDFTDFNRGDYIGAMESKVLSENITKVLYPNDNVEGGRELRLKQQYFMVAATLKDIVRRHEKHHESMKNLPDVVAVQLNDTHPAIAIPELMRILLDEKKMEWDVAWDICTRTFAYTNHTVLPEALETWPLELLGRLLPRHLEIIFEINRRFLDSVHKKYPEDLERLARMSLIGEGAVRTVRMANLAIVGSHTVNGVAELHSKIIKKTLFRDFDEMYPGKLINVTNGITPRRWLLQSNKFLSKLITDTIGPEWICDLDRLKELIPFAEDADFRKRWAEAKLQNKKRFARYVLRKVNMGINPKTLFDVHVKRMHEYKRQMLNIMHVIARYNRIKENPAGPHTPRTVFFGGKAAPGYLQAKLILKLICSVADKVNGDSEVSKLLRVIFLPNYCISQAEKVIPAADLSEQISTAGLEASGTGNMKFALNGALTIGTLDGANIEIMEEVGEDNIFIFGLTADEVTQLRAEGYDPYTYYQQDGELRKVIDQIHSGFFTPYEPGLFEPLVDGLLNGGDYYMLLADFRSYMDAQSRVDALFDNQEEWTRRAILNTANMGKFSSDRSVMEYVNNIWKTAPLGTK
jgi:starch phosphorylase